MGKKIFLYFLILILINILLGCASSRGSTFKKTYDSGKKSSSQNKSVTSKPRATVPPASSPTPSPSPNATDDENNQETTNPEEEEEEIIYPAFTIDSTPSGADIYLDYNYKGSTPKDFYEEEGYYYGTYELKLEKQGYYPYKGYLDYHSFNQSFHFHLEKIMGYLKIESDSPSYVISIDGQDYYSGLHKLGIGTYRINAKAFGYIEKEYKISVEENKTTPLFISLDPAPFELKSFDISKSRFNPDNPGGLGTIALSFTVTSHGRGEATIINPQGKMVFKKIISEFTQEDHSFPWNGKIHGDSLESGFYTVILEAVDKRTEKIHTIEKKIEIDRSLVLNFRSLLSGQSGTLLTACTDQLPEEYAQLSGLFIAHIQDDGTMLAPLELALRAGLFKETELNIQVNLLIKDSGSNPFFISAGLRTLLFRTKGETRISSAINVKAVFHSGTGADTLSHYTGLTIGLPLQLQLGALIFILQPDITISPWFVTYNDAYDSNPDFYSWSYGRAAILFDRQNFSAALSTALRTKPYIQGFLLDLPLQLGAEFNFFVPSTQMLISINTLGEFDSLESWYLMGGIGFHFLF